MQHNGMKPKCPSVLMEWWTGLYATVFSLLSVFDFKFELYQSFDNADSDPSAYITMQFSFVLPSSAQAQAKLNWAEA